MKWVKCSVVVLAGVLLLAGCGGSADGLSAVGQPGLPGPAEGMRADVDGRGVRVAFQLDAAKARGQLVLLGMRLPDGRALYPSTVRALRDGGALDIEVAYAFAHAGQADGAVFSVALGSPASDAGRRMGITMGVTPSSGEPFGRDYMIVLAPRTGGIPVPPAPVGNARTASFRLAAGPAGRVVLVPAEPARTTTEVALRR